jgi:sulfonate transport system substrate-binding protein
MRASDNTGAGGLGALGGATGSGVNATAGTGVPDTAPYPAITFAGLTSALELAPVRLAAGGIYPGSVSITSGGVDNLFSSAGALVASNAETQALRASVQHADLRIIFTICEGLYRIVAKRSAGIQTLADLRGKRIALPVGTSSNYYVVKMLALASLTEQDITVVNQMPGMGTLNADAASVWEPGIQYVADNLKDDAIEFQKDDHGAEVYRELFNLHATAETLSDPSKRRAIVRFVRALIDASAQIRSDPSPAYALLTGPSGASQAVLQRSWPYERFAGGLVPDLLDVLEQEEVWRAQLDGRTARARADLAPLIDDSVFKEASGI